jgi:dCTP diphosphatase
MMLNATRVPSHNLPMTHDPIQDLTRAIRAFSEARDWGQFHTPKNLVMALSVEVAELVEHFQWLTPEEAEALAHDDQTREELTSEIADVTIFLLRLADVLDVDVGEAVRRKLERNEARFPADEIRGRATLSSPSRPFERDKGDES